MQQMTFSSFGKLWKNLVINEIMPFLNSYHYEFYIWQIRMSDCILTEYRTLQINQLMLREVELFTKALIVSARRSPAIKLTFHENWRRFQNTPVHFLIVQ